MRYDKTTAETSKAAQEMLNKARDMKTLAVEVQMLEQRTQMYMDRWRQTPIERVGELKNLRKMIEQLMELKIKRAEMFEHLTKH